jgi:hypothetical protein
MNDELESVELVELGTASEATRSVMGETGDNDVTIGEHQPD